MIPCSACLRRAGAVLLVLLICATALPVMAQDDDPFLRHHSAEVIFPATVRVYLRLGGGIEDLLSVRLRITQGERELFQQDIDFETAFANVPDSPNDLRYDWAVTLDNAPALFEPVIYHWTVFTVDSQTYEAEGQFLFQQIDSVWQQAGEPPLRLASFDDVALNRARDALLSAYERMADDTGLSPDLAWVILPQGYTFCSSDAEGNAVVLDPNGSAYPCEESFAERLFARDGYRLLQRAEPGLTGLQNDLIADLFSVFYGTAWRGSTLPDWFRSGLAQLYRVTSNPLALQVMQDEARSQTYLQAADLRRRPPSAALNNPFDQQAYTMALYLADRYGATAPFTLAQDIPAQGFESAFADLTGGDVDSFLLDWSRWLFSDAAAQAVAWTLYSPDTPTPRPSATATATREPDTPTPTATITATPSDTPTPTPRVQQFSTIPPTHTPTPDVVRPPTHTPRPPGSLEQAPSPTPASAASGGGGPCTAPAPALLLPAVAIVLTRRRKR